MAIAEITNGESGSSVRGKLNAIRTEVNKLDLDGANNGDVLEWDGTEWGPATPSGGAVSELKFLTDKPNLIEFWDGLNRAATGSSEPMGTNGSGQTYENIVGTSGRYDGRDNYKALRTTGSDIAGFDIVNPLFPNTFSSMFGEFRFGNWVNNEGIYFWVDSQNWLYIGSIGANTFGVIVNEANSQTTLASETFNLATRSTVKAGFNLSINASAYRVWVENLVPTTSFTLTTAQRDNILMAATKIGFTGVIHNYILSKRLSFGN